MIMSITRAEKTLNEIAAEWAAVKAMEPPWRRSVTLASIPEGLSRALDALLVEISPPCAVCGKSAREGRHATDLGQGHDYVYEPEGSST